MGIICGREQPGVVVECLQRGETGGKAVAFGREVVRSLTQGILWW